MQDAELLQKTFHALDKSIVHSTPNMLNLILNATQKTDLDLTAFNSFTKYSLYGQINMFWNLNTGVSQGDLSYKRRTSR